MRVQEAVFDIRMEHLQRASLPHLCVEVRMSITGASDPWPNNRMRTIRDVLVARLDSWEGGINHPADIEFDEAVRNLVAATIRYIDERWSPLGNCDHDWWVADDCGDGMAAAKDWTTEMILARMRKSLQ